jgi:hypothetical protein
MLEQLDVPDFADDLALLSHNQSQMQNKTATFETVAASIWLEINTDKTKVVLINRANSSRRWCTGGCYRIHLSRKCRGYIRRHRQRHQSEDMESQNSFQYVEEHMDCKRSPSPLRSGFSTPT